MGLVFLGGQHWRFRSAVAASRHRVLGSNIPATGTKLRACYGLTIGAEILALIKFLHILWHHAARLLGTVYQSTAVDRRWNWRQRFTGT
jgi:hypothetical protein